MKLEFFRRIFETYSNIKFHENMSSEKRVATCGRADRPADVTKLIVAFRSFPNASFSEHNNEQVTHLPTHAFSGY